MDEAITPGMHALLAVVGEYESLADPILGAKRIIVHNDIDVTLTYNEPDSGVSLFNRDRPPTPERLRAVFDAMQWPKRGEGIASPYFFTPRQLDTVTAALRAYQALLDKSRPDMEWLAEISENTGPALSIVEIEELLETALG